MAFFDGANLLATVPVAADGTASLTTGFTTTGAHTIAAFYDGNDNCFASNGTTTVEVTQAPPPPGPCLLICGSLLNMDFDDIRTTYDIHDTYDSHNTYHFHNTYDSHKDIHNIHNTYNVHNVGSAEGGNRPWKPEWDKDQKSH